MRLPSPSASPGRPRADRDHDAQRLGRPPGPHGELAQRARHDAQRDVVERRPRAPGAARAARREQRRERRGVLDERPPRADGRFT
jgi:hypothetical protein